MRAAAARLRAAARRGRCASRAVVVGGARRWSLLCGLLATRLGSEFIPSLDEGDIAHACAAHPRHQPRRRPSRCSRTLEARIAQFPEVERVFGKIGTAEVATDPMPPSVADTFVMLKPRDAVARSAQAQGAAASPRSKPRCKQLPGNNYEFTQPIQMRMNELISGVRADVAVKVYGDDLDTLVDVGEQIETRRCARCPARPTSSSSRPPACRC